MTNLSLTKPAPTQRRWLTLDRLAAWPAILATLLLYLPTIWYSWAADDHWYVVDKPWSALPGMFNLLDPNRFFYRPLSAVSYFLSYELFGDNPHAWHAVNVVWYLLCVWLCFLFMQRLVRVGVASIAALLFAIHPLHPGAAAWIAALADLQAATFFLLASWAWLVYRQEQRRGYYWLTVVSVALALLSKEAATTLPLVIIIGDLLLNRNPAIQHKLRTAFLYFGVALPLLIYLGLRVVNLNSGGVILYNFWWRNQPGELVISGMVYLLNTFGIQIYTLNSVQVVACLLLFAAIGVIALRLGRAASFMVLWVLFTLAPVVPYLTAINFPPGRTVLIASVGACLLLATLLTDLYHRASQSTSLQRRLVLGAGGLIIVAFLSGAALHNYDWYVAGEVNKRIIADFNRLQPELPPDPIIYFRDVPYAHGIATVVGNRGLRYMLRRGGGPPLRVLDMDYTSPDKYCLPGNALYFATAPDGSVTKLPDCATWLTWKGGS